MNQISQPRRPTLTLSGVKRPQASQNAPTEAKQAACKASTQPVAEKTAQSPQITPEMRHEIVGKLINTFPAVFRPDSPVPLAIGIDKRVIKATTLSRLEVGAALRWWCKRLVYLDQLAKPGSERHNLDGSVSEPVSDDDRKSAESWAEKKRSKRRAKQARRQANDAKSVARAPVQQETGNPDPQSVVKGQMKG